MDAKKSPAERGKSWEEREAGGIVGDDVCLRALSSRRHQGFRFMELQRNFREALQANRFRRQSQRKTPRERGADSSQDLGRFSSTHLAWFLNALSGYPAQGIRARGP